MQCKCKWNVQMEKFNTILRENERQISEDNKKHS